MSEGSNVEVDHWEEAEPQHVLDEAKRIMKEEGAIDLNLDIIHDEKRFVDLCEYTGNREINLKDAHRRSGGYENFAFKLPHKFDTIHGKPVDESYHQDVNYEKVVLSEIFKKDLSQPIVSEEENARVNPYVLAILMIGFGKTEKEQEATPKYVALVFKK